MSAEIPTTIGRYQVLERIGAGGMGTVYKALQPGLNRVVAIKVLTASLADDPVLAERFAREVTTLARLSHLNIVNIIDSGSDEATTFFAMEYVDGVNLAELLNERRLSLGEVLRVIRAIGHGVDYAHRMGVIHRDLKLSNVLVTRDLTSVKVADFGISRVDFGGETVAQLTTTHASLGTLYYMAPEQATNAASVDRRADVYSLGVLSYQLLTGRIPIGRFSLPSQVNPNLPPELDPIVLRCLLHDPEERYGDVASMLRELARVEELVGFRLLDNLKIISQSASSALKARTTRIVKQNRAWVISAAVGTAVLLWAALRSQLAPPPPAGVEQPVPAVTVNAAPIVSAAPPHSSAAVTPPPVPAAPRSAVPNAATPARVTRRAESAPPPARAAAATAAKLSAVEDAKQAEASRAVELIRAKIEAGQGRQVLGELQGFVTSQVGTPAGLDGLLLLGQLNSALKRHEQAMANYRDAASVYASDSRAGLALFRLAQLQTSQKRRRDAITSYETVVARYPDSGWALPALVAKADLEEKESVKALDPKSRHTVPAALLTYQALVAAHPSSREAEAALWKLGRSFADLNRYEDAADTYLQLATTFPGTTFDAAFQAGEWYERRLKNTVKAVAAYRLVPAGSRNAGKAAERIARLGRP